MNTILPNRSKRSMNAPPPASSSPSAMLEAYLDGAMGIHFDALSRFARPLFELYGIDLRASLSKPDAARTDDEVNTLVTVLDTARLFWAYFSLSEEDRAQHAEALRACLVGPDPDAGAARSLDDLMDLMRDRWDDLSDSRRHHAEQMAPSSLPGFETLLEQHTSSMAPGTAPSGGYGPDQLDQPEALALFAQPLLDDPSVHTDPDALEERMALATAYWELAHLPGSARSDKLQTVLHRFADSTSEREQLRDQAQSMLERFEELFPERTS